MELYFRRKELSIKYWRALTDVVVCSKWLHMLFTHFLASTSVSLIRPKSLENIQLVYTESLCIGIWVYLTSFQGRLLYE